MIEVETEETVTILNVGSPNLCLINLLSSVLYRMSNKTQMFPGITDLYGSMRVC